MTTLRQILTQPKPNVHSTITSRGPTKDNRWPKLHSISTWNEFNLVNLNSTYSNVLDQVTLNWQQAPPFLSIEVNEPKDVNHMFAWNDHIMRNTLEIAMLHLGLIRGITIRHQVSSTDNSTRVSVPYSTKNLAVDHVISLNTNPERTLIVGLGKPSSKFSGIRLQNQINKPSSALTWPLKQLANLCKMAGTMYGYIQTELDLTVCFFTQYGDNWDAHIFVTPWSLYDSENLTADLALWWLAMRAVQQRQFTN